MGTLNETNTERKRKDKKTNIGQTAPNPPVPPRTYYTRPIARLGVLLWGLPTRYLEKDADDQAAKTQIRPTIQ